MASSNQKLAFPALVALVVGSMVGAGIFSLPATFGRATGVFGALIAWAIAGGGMLALAFVFQTLSRRKPELDAGIYAYAKAGFGNYPGFISALGFWAGTCVGNVSYWVLIKATLGAFFPIFGDGNTLVAFLVASVSLWIFHTLVLMGVKQAAGVNTIVTLAKLIPLAIFVIVSLRAFDMNLFSLNFWGGVPDVAPPTDLAHLDYYGQVGLHSMELPSLPANESLFAQVRNTMLVTVFVFLGIEGASVYSRYAKNRKDVGTATVLGFIGVLGLLVVTTMIGYSLMTRPELAALRQPSVAGVFEAVVGRWGTVFISVGLIISVLGAYLSWSLLAAEVLYSAAKSQVMPKFLTKENARAVPSSAMWLTSGLVQALLIATMFSEYAFILALELTSSFSLIAYLLVAAFGLKAAFLWDGYESNDKSRNTELATAFIATAYSLLMIYAGGMKYVLLSALIFAPGSLLYVLARREQGQRLFTPVEKGILAVIVVMFVAAVVALATGRIVI